jgi:hypothetical protein
MAEWGRWGRKGGTPRGDVDEGRYSMIIGGNGSRFMPLAESDREREEGGRVNADKQKGRKDGRMENGRMKVEMWEEGEMEAERSERTENGEEEPDYATFHQ